jgi:hypothetical protein
MPKRSTPAVTLCAVTILAATAPLQAQTDAPAGEATAFSEAMDAALADGGSASSLLRCTALFRAFRLYAGEGTEVGMTAAEHETGLAVAAVVVWQDDTGTEDLEEAFEIIVPMVSEATDLFLARMSDNMDADDRVFDDALEAELTYCDTLHDEIAEASGE